METVRRGNKNQRSDSLSSDVRVLGSVVHTVSAGTQGDGGCERDSPLKYKTCPLLKDQLQEQERRRRILRWGTTRSSLTRLLMSRQVKLGRIRRPRVPRCLTSRVARHVCDQSGDPQVRPDRDLLEVHCNCTWGVMRAKVWNK